MENTDIDNYTNSDIDCNNSTEVDDDTQSNPNSNYDNLGILSFIIENYDDINIDCLDYTIEHLKKSDDGNEKINPFIFRFLLRNYKRNIENLENKIVWLIENDKFSDLEISFDIFNNFVINDCSDSKLISINIFKCFIENGNIYPQKSNIEILINNSEKGEDYSFACLKYLIENKIINSHNINEIIIKKICYDYSYLKTIENRKGNEVVQELVKFIFNKFTITLSPSLFTILFSAYCYSTIASLLQKCEVQNVKYCWNLFVNRILKCGGKLSDNELEPINDIFKYFIKEGCLFTKEQMNTYFSTDYYYDKYTLKTILPLLINSDYEFKNNYFDKIIKIIPEVETDKNISEEIFNNFKFTDEHFKYFADKSQFDMASMILISNLKIKMNEKYKEEIFKKILENDKKYFEQEYKKIHYYWRKQDKNIKDKYLNKFIGLFNKINIDKDESLFILDKYDFDAIVEITKNNYFISNIKNNFMFYLENSSLKVNKNIIDLVQEDAINDLILDQKTIDYTIKKGGGELIYLLLSKNIIKSNNLNIQNIQNIILDKNQKIINYLIDNKIFEKNKLDISSVVEIIGEIGDANIILLLLEKNIFNIDNLDIKSLENIVLYEDKKTINYLIDNKFFEKIQINNDFITNLAKEITYDETILLPLKKNIFSNIKLSNSDFKILIEYLGDKTLLEFLDFPCCENIELNDNLLEAACLYHDIEIAKLCLENKTLPKNEHYTKLFNDVKYNKEEIIKMTNLLIHYGYQLSDENIILATEKEIELEPSQYTKKFVPTEDFYKKCKKNFIPKYENVDQNKAMSYALISECETVAGSRFSLRSLKSSIIAHTKKNKTKLKLSETAKINLSTLSTYSGVSGRIASEIKNLCE
jgi:hypothetical protein